MKNPSPGLFLIAGLTCWAAILSLSGWVLSFFHALTPFSYGWILALLSGVTCWFFKGLSWLVFFRKALQRLRQPLPAVFAGGGCLVLVGALLYPPANYDALTYRIPRVMHWLSQDGWHWISTANPRQNYSGVGQEWLLAPLIDLTKTDRLLFLPNFLCFVLLPSVLFRFFRGIGCSGRMAATVMWLLPFAPVYLLQAGGVANDLLGSFWFLASLALLPGLAVKGCFPGSSLLALALSTAVKASNLVLLFPWLIKFLSEALRKRSLWRPLLIVSPIALAISFAPVAYFNAYHTGDWSGDPLNEGGMKTQSPGIVFIGNMLLTVSASLQQPIDLGSYYLFKKAGEYVPGAIKDALQAGYPRWSLEKAEFAIEEGASWSWLLALFCLSGFFRLRVKRSYFFWLGTAAWLSAIVVMGKLASESVPRLLAPLYPLLFLPAGLVGARSSRFFRVWVFFSLSLLLIPLFLAPSRPLIPWNQIGQWIQVLEPDSKLAARIFHVEQAYRERAQGLQPVIPESLRNQPLDILLISNGNDTEGPLWKSYGTRRVQSRLPLDPLPVLPPRVILIREKDWPKWEQHWGVEARVKNKASLALLARVGPENWLCLEPVLWPSQR